MKTHLALIAASSYALALTPAFAGTQTGYVKDVYVRDSDGLVLVDLFGTATGRAPCALGTSYWIVANESTDAGKRLYSTLLAAQLAGRLVSIEGKNTCSRWPDGEDIETVGVHGLQSQ